MSTRRFAQNILLLGCVLLGSACGTWTMTVTRQELQADIATRFPVEIDKHVVVVRLTDPVIEFPGPADRVALRMNVAANSALANTTGSVRAEGRIEYLEAEHAFYLREPVITDLHMNPPEAGSPAGGLIERLRAHVDPAMLDHLARSAAEEALRHQPIYRLDENRSEREAKAIRHLRSVHVRDDTLLLEVGLKPS